MAFLSAAEFKQVENALNKQLLEWCSNSAGLSIIVKPKEACLHEKREWCCLLPNNKSALIPCGGTHVSRIQPTETVSVILKKETESDFVMISKLL